MTDLHRAATCRRMFGDAYLKQAMRSPALKFRDLNFDSENPAVGNA